MSDDYKNLPSIDDFAESSEELPSITELLEEEDLPSVEGYIEVEEEVQTIEDANGETFAEVKDIVPPWPELLRLVDEVRESIPDIPEIKYYDDDLEKISQTIEELRSEIPVVPEVKYYDNPIKDLKKELSKLDEKREEQGVNITELYKIVEELRGNQQELTEIYNDRPIGPDPKEKQGNDPLTPTDQKFATLQDLASNYRLFVNRVEQQLYTIGGGGAGFLKDLDDVNISGLVNGDTIIWNSSTSKWDVGSVSSGSTTWIHDAVGIHTLSNVGIATTARSDSALYVEGTATITGDLNVTGDIVYDEVDGSCLLYTSDAADE